MRETVLCRFLSAAPVRSVYDSAFHWTAFIDVVLVRRVRLPLEGRSSTTGHSKSSCKCVTYGSLSFETILRPCRCVSRTCLLLFTRLIDLVETISALGVALPLERRSSATRRSQSYRECARKKLSTIFFHSAASAHRIDDAGFHCTAFIPTISVTRVRLPLQRR